MAIETLGPDRTSYRGPRAWLLVRSPQRMGFPGFRGVLAAWLVLVAVSVVMGLLNVWMGWNGIPLSVAALTVDLTIYPPFLIALLLTIWLGPGWGMVPLYLAKVASALATGMAPRSGRLGRGVSLPFLDLDQFKLLKDRRGHVTGDRVLRHFARRLAELEILVPLPHTGPGQAPLREERDPPLEWQRLVARADDAAHRAKDGGRSRVAQVDFVPPGSPGAAP